MKTWDYYFQLNGEERSIYSSIGFPITEKLYNKIQSAIAAKKLLSSCDFYGELLERAEKAFDYTDYAYYDEPVPERSDYDSQEEYLEAKEEYDHGLESAIDDLWMVRSNIYDPTEEYEFKQLFIGRIYPDYVDTDSADIEFESYDESAIRYSLTVKFDEYARITDITDISAMGLESEDCRSSSYGDAYPDYDFMEYNLEEELGDEYDGSFEDWVAELAEDEDFDEDNE